MRIFYQGLDFAPYLEEIIMQTGAVGLRANDFQIMVNQNSPSLFDDATNVRIKYRNWDLGLYKIYTDDQFISALRMAVKTVVDMTKPKKKETIPSRKRKTVTIFSKYRPNIHFKPSWER